MTLRAKVLLALAAMALGSLLLGVLLQSASAPPSASAAVREADAPEALPIEASGPRADLELSRAVVSAETHRELGAASKLVGKLTVRVLFADRTPATECLVIVQRAGGDLRIGATRRPTDEEGRAHFLGLGAGRVEVRTNLLELANHLVDVRTGEETEYELVLPAGLSVSGVVIDFDGAPVPGAEVYLCSVPSFGRDAEPVATTDDKGEFALRGCPSRCLVGARADGFAPSRMYFVHGSTGGSLEVKIELPAKGGNVQGVVRGADGAPVRGAVVRIGEGSLDQIRASTLGAPPLPAQERTDRQGAFRALGLAPGEHPVVVRAAGHAPWTGACVVDPGATTSMEIALTEGVTVRGTARDEHDRPIAEVAVRMGKQGLLYYRTRTDDLGRYQLDGLPPGEIELTAYHGLLGNRVTTLHGKPGDTLTWDPVLTRGFVLRGRVLTATGEPVQHVHIHLRAVPKKGGKAWWDNARTDGDGRFEVANCPDDRLLDLSGKGRDIEDIETTRVDPRAGEVLLQAVRVVAEQAKILGRVVAPDGEPLAHAQVYASSILPATTEEGSGRFEILVPPGKYKLAVHSGDYPTQLTPEYEVVDGDTFHVGTVKLLHGGRIRVQLGELPAGTGIGVRADGDRYLTMIDPSISLLSNPIIPGRHEIVLRRDGEVVHTQEVEVRAGEETSARIELK